MKVGETSIECDVCKNQAPLSKASGWMQVNLTLCRPSGSSLVEMMDTIKIIRGNTKLLNFLCGDCVKRLKSGHRHLKLSIF